MMLMFGRLRESYFSFEGRLGRVAFFTRSIYLSIAVTVLGISCVPLFSNGHDLLWWIALTILICIGAGWLFSVASLTVRRLHDMQLSGYHAIWVVGAQLVWMPISYGPPLA